MMIILFKYKFLRSTRIHMKVSEIFSEFGRKVRVVVSVMMWAYVEKHGRRNSENRCDGSRDQNHLPRGPRLANDIYLRFATPVERSSPAAWAAPVGARFSMLRAIPVICALGSSL